MLPTISNVLYQILFYKLTDYTSLLALNSTDYFHLFPGTKLTPCTPVRSLILSTPTRCRCETPSAGPPSPCLSCNATRTPLPNLSPSTSRTTCSSLPPPRESRGRACLTPKTAPGGETSWPSLISNFRTGYLQTPRRFFSMCSAEDN